MTLDELTKSADAKGYLWHVAKGPAGHHAAVHTASGTHEATGPTAADALAAALAKAESKPKEGDK